MLAALAPFIHSNEIQDLLTLSIFLNMQFPFSQNMASPFPSPLFTVRRCQPELVAPSMPTPNDVKLLSDIDDQEGFRFHVPLIYIYRHEPSMSGKDPVKVIRDALAQTLVFYYPFAGRLREGPGRKLMVDCTGEGVIFIEADADVKLDQFGDTLQSALSSYQQFVYDVPGSEGIINCPLLLIQVTRLKCGGFIVGTRLNHTMSDGTGILQFMNAMAEIARGAREPSISPVWRRELLCARDPPQITCKHREYEEVPKTKEGSIVSNEDDMVQQYFFFRPDEISAIRRLVPLHHSKCTRFEVITAYLWCCLTKGLQLNQEDEVRMMCIVNARPRLNPPLPVGYYGNVFAYPAALTTAGKLSNNPIVSVVELIKKAKVEVTDEYIHSVADLMVIKGRPLFTTVRSFVVSDLTHIGFRDVNFGWGKAVYAGVPKAGANYFPGVIFLSSCKNAKGEEGIIIPICLPVKAMRKFAKELDNMLGNQNQPLNNGQYRKFIMSTL